MPPLWAAPPTLHPSPSICTLTLGPELPWMPGKPWDMTEHKGHRGSQPPGVATSWPLLLPSAGTTPDTHLPRRADLPREARGALEPRATSSSTLTLGAVTTLWRMQPASGP